MNEREYQAELDDRLRQLHKDHYIAQGETNDAYWRFMDMAQALIGCNLQQAYIRTEFLFRPENFN
jgi:hypothetical protein